MPPDTIAGDGQHKARCVVLTSVYTERRIGTSAANISIMVCCTGNVTQLA